jgi:small GTP-binding protein
METDREKLTLVVTGHVDHGKSTVIGRLLYDTGALPQGTIDRVRVISQETGQPFEFAFLLDAFEEERRQGITIDTTRLQFRTAKRDYLIIDAPGHKEFLKNMISGASDAEAAFLVVDAERGVEEQTRRHAHMLSLLGVGRVGVLVNKMDLVGYSSEVFSRIQDELAAFLWHLGLAAGPFVPLSALAGENILTPSPRLAWHSGPSLIGALDSLPKNARSESLRLPIQDVYKFDDRRIIAGRLASGRIGAGDEILISPGQKKTKVSSLAYWLEKDKKSVALVGESIGLTVADEFFNHRGEVISSVEDPPTVTDRFKASIFWMGKTPLIKNKNYKLKLATFSSEMVVEEIYNLIDSNSLAPLSGAGAVSFNEVAEVAIHAAKALAVDLFADHKETGRFVVVDGYDVAGGGIVTSLLARPASERGFVRGEVVARCEVFEEYYYNLATFSVTKKEAPQAVFQVGDSVPLRGRSYSYPDSFDIVVFRDQVAVRIREGKVQDILALDEYSFASFPLVNGRGFALKVQTPAEWATARSAFLTETTRDEAELAAKYLDFNAYRKIAFIGDE